MEEQAARGLKCKDVRAPLFEMQSQSYKQGNPGGPVIVIQQMFLNTFRITLSIMKSNWGPMTKKKEIQQHITKTKLEYSSLNEGGFISCKYSKRRKNQSYATTFKNQGQLSKNPFHESDQYIPGLVSLSF